MLEAQIKEPTQQLDRPVLPNAINKKNGFIFIQNRIFSIPFISGIAHNCVEKIIQVEAELFLYPSVC